MKLYYFIPILVLFIVLFIQRRNRHTLIARRIIQKRKTEEKARMELLAKKFIDKECLLYSFDGHQYEGTVKEVGGGAVLIEKDGKEEAINLDFIVRIREYPRDKKGKKKSVVLD